MRIQINADSNIEGNEKLAALPRQMVLQVKWGP
jgi:hypothetical protein